MNFTKQELIGWASQGIEYVKTGLNHVLEQLESKLETEVIKDTDCFKKTEKEMWGASPKIVKDVCEFKDRLSQMWEDKEPEKPKTLSDYVRMTRQHIDEINALYGGLLEMANKIDAKARAERKELESKLEDAKKLLDDYRYHVGGKNQKWSQDSDVKKNVAQRKAKELEDIKKALDEQDGKKAAEVLLGLNKTDVN